MTGRRVPAQRAAEDIALTETLALAVPFRILELRHQPAWRRRQIAAKAAGIVSHQGDSLMFGSGHAFGHGGAQQAAHESGLHARRNKPGDGPRTDCRVCTAGQAAYSPGEVFNALADGLACAALLPGGVSFAGLHWCTAEHDGCPRAARPAGGPS